MIMKMKKIKKKMMMIIKLNTQKLDNNKINKNFYKIFLPNKMIVGSILKEIFLNKINSNKIHKITNKQQILFKTAILTHFKIKDNKEKAIETEEEIRTKKMTDKLLFLLKLKLFLYKNNRKNYYFYYFVVK